MAGTGLYGFRLGDGNGRIQVAGLKEVQYSLTKLGADSRNELKPAHKAAAELVVVKARPMAPVRTGALRDTLRAFGRQRAGVVRAGNVSAPYAGPIVFGWPKRHIKANPFIYKAADQRRGEIIALYETRMAELIRKNGLAAGYAAPAASQAFTGLLK